METTQKIENNNQNVATQNTPSTSKSGYANETYFYVSKAHSTEFAQMPQYQNFNHACDDDDYQISYRTLTELCNKNIWYQSNEGHSSEEPIDLTCAEKRSENNRTTDTARERKNRLLVQVPALDLPTVRDNPNFHFENQSHVDLTEFPKIRHSIANVKKRGRKRKYEIKKEPLLEELQVQNSEPSLLKSIDNPNYLQIADNKQAEVVKAAKSLFSKRTRTLYHWMYPTAPKAQLKTAIASSWETLGIQEKEFYISQVLGRFGFPQTNLMVNPQLGGITGISPLPLLDLATTNHVGNEETSTAVSTLLMSENRSFGDGSWIQANQSNSTDSLNCPQFSQKIHRKRGRLGRPPGSKNRRQAKTEITLLKQIREDPAPDEFQDDPELCREFQQFKWTLHLSDGEKS